ncbi:hypothetical protein C9I50_18380 [Pseudomonas prosekii]|nr:hypothetical protein C9I50_18380 [Pseudomonas prosekii]
MATQSCITKGMVMSKSSGGKSGSAPGGKSSESKAPPVANLPSTTGKPSGGGRGNAPAKGK